MPFEPVFKSSGGFQPVLRPQPSVEPVTINTGPLEFWKRKLFATADVAQKAAMPVSTLSGMVRGNPQEQGVLENIVRGAGSLAMMAPGGGVPILTEQAVKSGLETGNPLKPATDMAAMPFQAVMRQVTGEAGGMTREQAWNQQPVEEALSILAPFLIAKGVKSGMANRGSAPRVPEILRAAIQKEVSPVAEQRVMGVSRETPTVKQPTTAPEVVAKAKPNAVTGNVKTLTPDELTAAQARLREKFKPMDEAIGNKDFERLGVQNTKQEANSWVKKLKSENPTEEFRIVEPEKKLGKEGQFTVERRAGKISTEQPTATVQGAAERPAQSIKHPLQREASAYLENVDRIKKLEKKQKGAEYDSDIHWLGETDTILRREFNKSRQNGELFGDFLTRISGRSDLKPKSTPFLADYPDLAAKYGKQGGESVELGALGTPSAIKDFIQGESALNKAWEGVVDKGKAKIGQYIPDVIKRALAPSHDRSQAWMEAKDQTRFAKMQGIEETTNLAREAKSAIPKTDLEKAYDYLDPTERGVERPTLPESQAKPLDAMRERLKSMGQEAVDAGVLKPEDYAAGIDTYLKRTYLKYEVPTARKLFRQFRIKGTKGRVLKTAEERTEAGIIRDPVYNFAKGAAELRHDIETAKLFKKVAESPEFSDQVGTEWKEGFANRSVPKRPEFGALQGKYVSQGIYDDLMEMQKYWDKGTAGRIYDKLLGSWKYSKTILNPSTWARNGWSSMFQADQIGGLPLYRTDVYAAAAKEMAAHTGDFAELVQAGKMRRSTYTADISEFASFLDRGGNVTALERMADYMMSGKKISNFAQRLGGAYGGMEDFFKLAVYKYQKGLGKSSQAALKIAEQAIPDYRVSTPFVNKVARYAVPFIKYPYKILPAVAEAAIKHPLRFGKYPLLIYLINQYAKDQLGLSEEEYKKLQDTKKFSGSSSMLMPFNDKQGNPLVLDLTYNLPWGDALEHGAGFAGAAGLTESNNWGGRILSMFNPLAKIPAEMAFNKSTYSGREIYNPRVDTGAELFMKLMKHGYQQMSPPLAPGNYAWNEVSRTITGKPNYLGEKPSAAATIFKQLGGLKTSPVNVEHETKMEKVDITKNMDAIEKVMWNVTNDKSLDDEERQKRMALLKKKWYAELAKLHSQ